jgi:hypothetical protein
MNSVLQKNVSLFQNTRNVCMFVYNGTAKVGSALKGICAFRRSLNRFSKRTPDIHTNAFSGFTQSFQVTAYSTGHSTSQYIIMSYHSTQNCLSI